MNIEIVKGSVVYADCDAVVNAANSYLSFGGGLCGEIYLEAGIDELTTECTQIGSCDVGDAVITNGYNLKAKYIIHAVSPIYDFDNNPSEKLKSAYLKSLTLADKKGLKSIAFPSLGTGINGYPLNDASEIALTTIINYQSKNLEKCMIYCYLDEEYNIYTKLFNKLSIV